MNALNTLPFVAAYVALFLGRSKIGAFGSICGTIVAVLLHLKLGVEPPLPASVYSLFAAFVLVAAVLYVTASKKTLDDFVAPIRAMITTPRLRLVLLGVLVAVPLLVGWTAWRVYQPDTSAPPTFRVVHPAPPKSVVSHGATIDMKSGVNPFRHLKKDDPVAFAKAVLEGKRVYYQNCYFCHGDELGGAGHFARGFNPRPISFQDDTTIPMFTETFLFWRVAKGGRGLPAAATPWDSSMPVWEDFLSNDEMWKVILFLYAQTGQQPRVVSGGHK